MLNQQFLKLKTKLNSFIQENEESLYKKLNNPSKSQKVIRTVSNLYNEASDLSKIIKSLKNKNQLENISLTLKNRKKKEVDDSELLFIKDNIYLPEHSASLLLSYQSSLNLVMKTLFSSKVNVLVRLELSQKLTASKIPNLFLDWQKDPKPKSLPINESLKSSLFDFISDSAMKARKLKGSTISKQYFLLLKNVVSVYSVVFGKSLKIDFNEAFEKCFSCFLPNNIALFVLNKICNFTFLGISNLKQIRSVDEADTKYMIMQANSEVMKNLFGNKNFKLSVNDAEELKKHISMKITKKNDKGLKNLFKSLISLIKSRLKNSTSSSETIIKLIFDSIQIKLKSFFMVKSKNKVETLDEKIGYEFILLISELLKLTSLKFVKNESLKNIVIEFSENIFNLLIISPCTDKKLLSLLANKFNNLDEKFTERLVSRIDKYFFMDSIKTKPLLDSFYWLIDFYLTQNQHEKVYSYFNNFKNFMSNFDTDSKKVVNKIMFYILFAVSFLSNSNSIQAESDQSSTKDKHEREYESLINGQNNSFDEKTINLFNSSPFKSSLLGLLEEYPEMTEKACAGDIDASMSYFILPKNIHKNDDYCLEEENVKKCLDALSTKVINGVSSSETFGTFESVIFLIRKFFEFYPSHSKKWFEKFISTKLEFKKKEDFKETISGSIFEYLLQQKNNIVLISEKEKLKNKEIEDNVTQLKSLGGFIIFILQFSDHELFKKHEDQIFILCQSLLLFQNKSLNFFRMNLMCHICCNQNFRSRLQKLEYTQNENNLSKVFDFELLKLTGALISNSPCLLSLVETYSSNLNKNLLNKNLKKDNIFEKKMTAFVMFISSFAESKNKSPATFFVEYKFLKPELLSNTCLLSFSVLQNENNYFKDRTNSFNKLNNSKFNKFLMNILGIHLSHYDNSRGNIFSLFTKLFNQMNSQFALQNHLMKSSLGYFLQVVENKTHDDYEKIVDGFFETYNNQIWLQHSFSNLQLQLKYLQVASNYEKKISFLSQVKKNSEKLLEYSHFRMKYFKSLQKMLSKEVNQNSNMFEKFLSYLLLNNLHSVNKLKTEEFLSKSFNLFSSNLKSEMGNMVLSICLNETKKRLVSDYKMSFTIQDHLSSLLEVDYSKSLVIASRYFKNVPFKLKQKQKNETLVEIFDWIPLFESVLSQIMDLSKTSDFMTAKNKHFSKLFTSPSFRLVNNSAASKGVHTISILFNNLMKLLKTVGNHSSLKVFEMVKSNLFLPYEKNEELSKQWVCLLAMVISLRMRETLNIKYDQLIVFSLAQLADKFQLRHLKDFITFMSLFTNKKNCSFRFVRSILACVESMVFGKVTLSFSKFANSLRNQKDEQRTSQEILSIVKDLIEKKKIETEAEEEDFQTVLNINNTPFVNNIRTIMMIFRIPIMHYDCFNFKIRFHKIMKNLEFNSNVDFVSSIFFNNYFSYVNDLRKNFVLTSNPENLSKFNFMKLVAVPKKMKLEPNQGKEAENVESKMLLTFNSNDTNFLDFKMYLEKASQSVNYLVSLASVLIGMTNLKKHQLNHFKIVFGSLKNVVENESALNEEEQSSFLGIFRTFSQKHFGKYKLNNLSSGVQFAKYMKTQFEESQTFLMKQISFLVFKNTLLNNISNENYEIFVEELDTFVLSNNYLLMETLFKSFAGSISITSYEMLLPLLSQKLNRAIEMSPQKDNQHNLFVCSFLLSALLSCFLSLSTQNLDLLLEIFEKFNQNELKNKIYIERAKNSLKNYREVLKPRVDLDQWNYDNQKVKKLLELGGSLSYFA